MKNFLSLILTILTLAFVFVGCTPLDSDNSDTAAVESTLAPTTESADTTDTAETTSPSVSNPELIVFDKENAYCKLVVSLYAEPTVSSAAAKLNQFFADKCPVWNTVGIQNDYIQGQKKGEFYEVAGKEILVGLTNRLESKTVKDTLTKDQFAIKVVGEKLVIIGYDEYSTAAAIEYFIENYLKGTVANEMKFDGDFEYLGVQGLRKIPLSDEATYRIMSYNLGLLVSESVGGEAECVDILTRYLPDVMGLQECNGKIHTKVLSALPEFYAFAKEFHANGSTVNYTPIIYNKDLFKCLKADVIWLRGRYTGTNTKSLSWAVFEDNGGNKFALINYHGAVCNNSYKGFENYTKEQLNAQALEWKLDNVVQVIEIKDAIIAEFGNIPVMVSGDNNFNSSSQPYKNITEAGFADAEVTARVSKMTGYSTSYSYGKVPGNGKSIDHVFGIGGVDFVTHAIVRGDDVWKASDHCPIYVDFNIK